MQPDYRKTVTACYLGIITQAISANFAPLLFLTFRGAFGLTLEQVALIPTVFFFTQLIVDLASAKFVDKIGYRACILASEVFSAVGMVGLAFLPPLLASPFTGILICVTLYAIGSGLIEVLVSPIVEACPSENKAAAMSLMHSFYCWGVVAVILGSTLFFTLFGIENWRIMACLWTLVPLAGIYYFSICPIGHTVAVEKSMSIGQLLRLPLFWLLCLLMVCSGASELSMAQWASAFTEAALGVSKAVGDLAGPCLFAVLMGATRVLHSKFGAKANLTRVMLCSGVLCVVCYLAASLSHHPALGLAGCAICGVSIAILWPGTISISARACPAGGTAMFALLALAGDLGGALGPSLVGSVSTLAGDNLKLGLLAAIVFPVILIAGLAALAKGKSE